VETAIALVRLDDPPNACDTTEPLIRRNRTAAAGKAALERLSYSNDPKIRTRVAEGIGFGEHARAEDKFEKDLVFTLVRLLDDHHPSVVRAALTSLRKVAYAPSQDSNPLPAGTTEQIRWWKEWEKRVTARAVAGSRLERGF
jgi:hypothetical protein